MRNGLDRERIVLVLTAFDDVLPDHVPDLRREEVEERAPAGGSGDFGDCLLGSGRLEDADFGGHPRTGVDQGLVG